MLFKTIVGKRLTLSIPRITRAMLGVMFSLAAVVTTGQEVSVGVQGGFVLAAQDVGSGTGTTGWIPGARTGLSIDYSFMNSYHLVGDLAWMMKGQRTRDGATNTIGKSILHYAQFDLLSRFDIVDREKKPYVTVGPSFGYFLGGRLISEQDGSTISDKKIDAGNVENKFEISGVVGVGFDHGRWTSEFRGYLGFTSVGLRGGGLKNYALTAQLNWYLFPTATE